MSHRLRLLLIDDDNQFAQDFSLLSEKIFLVRHVGGGQEGVRSLEQDEPDAVLLDLRMGEGWDGLQTLRHIRERHPELPVVMVTDHADAETAVKAMKLGAVYYTSKKPQMAALHTVIERELQQVALKRLYLEENGKRYGRLIGDSVQIKHIYEQISRLARTGFSVLINGESGTGKELVAHEIHSRSDRAGEPFVAVDSGAVPSGLFESELFGYERGAFTGATGRHRGRLELAGGGTLFLDEIANLPLEAQAKLLRVLEERLYYRLGGEEPLPLKARIIVATNRKLEEEVTAGRFRQDLYYRLAGVQVDLPSLRERRKDIALIAGYFLQKFRSESFAHIHGFSTAALRVLEAYHWPGNVRELRNVVEQSMIYAHGPLIEEHDIHLRPLSSSSATLFADLLQRPYERAKEELITQFKAEYLRVLLQRHQGNVTAAARESGIARSSLHRMLAELGLRGR